MADDVFTPAPTGAGGGEALSFRIALRDGRNVVQLRGEINENADFSELLARLRGDVDLELEGITRINSCGVREWVNFVRDLRVTSLRFTRCSPTVVVQLNTIFNFRGRARVFSFLAPYVCERCHTDEYKILEVEEHFGPENRLHPTVPAFRCPRCGGVMMFDELPERYLSFLAEEQG
jgi:hypothetical protein